MTDDEIHKFLNEHRHWSRRRKLAFVKANIEIDVEAMTRQWAKEAFDAAVRDGLLVTTHDGQYRAAGDIVPANIRGVAGVVAQHYKKLVACHKS